MGCYRSIDEIAVWGSLSNSQRASIQNTLASRAAKYKFILNPSE